VRDAFEQATPFTVGLEEELMVLDAETLDLAPRAAAVIEALGGDRRFKLEMPAAQLEIVTAPHESVAAAAQELSRSRHALTAAGFRLAGAGAHPFASGSGPLNPGARYEAIGAEYASVARRQLVFGLHVHVAVPGTDRALAAYNAMRSYLPELAALAVNAPFYEGRDSGLASVRPRISGLLPRQGVPPAFETFEDYERALEWCGFDDPRQWWWELRLHPVLGTVEVRVPDTQRTVAETTAIGAIVRALAVRLCERYDAGEAQPVAESWRIDQNRWSACRYGLDGDMRDLETGELRPTRERVATLLDDLGVAMPPGDGAARQRAVAAERGLRGLVAWLADGFTG
jgi:glutamate---cysteine ligase / carboxylate-amine ligase